MISRSAVSRFSKLRGVVRTVVVSLLIAAAAGCASSNHTENSATPATRSTSSTAAAAPTTTTTTTPAPTTTRKPPSTTTATLPARRLPGLPVTRVVDGDTFKVRNGARVTTVRVLGIDTPETQDPRKPVQCFGREASNRAHQLLDGRTVRLEADPTQDPIDKYGRTLAYVWLPDGRLFQLVMLSEGYAHEYTYQVPYLRQAQFKAAQADARAHSRGLWSPSTCNGDTSRPAAGARPAPVPTTAAPARPGTVHPGSFCSVQGARGVTSAGTPMMCAIASDGRLRWRSG